MTLRRDSFPVDGFVLDVQWFGGIKDESPDSAMGRLDWDLDLRAFPDPDKHISDLASDHVGIIPIEDSYISTNTSTYTDAERRETDPGIFRSGREVRCGFASAGHGFRLVRPSWHGGLVESRGRRLDS